MFIIRNAIESDLESLFSLSKNANLLNLPANEEKLRSLIKASNESFLSPSKKLENNYYLFCLIDKTKNKTIGVSMVHGKHGTEEKPHYYLRVSKEIKESATLGTKIINPTLKLGIEPNGYTEIGGLILNPSYRGSPMKLGKQLSMSRFLYIIENENFFTEYIHSELLPPFDDKGRSLLWEGLGRKFLNMDYWEADILSQKNRTFIHDLFPSSTIYQNLLPKSASNVIGEVGKNTEPVKKMLESIGFKYTSEVDPFDGGPHYRAKLKDLKPYRDFQNIEGAKLFQLLDQNPECCFLCNTSSLNEDVSSNIHFSAVAWNYKHNQIKKSNMYKGFFI